MSVAAPLQLRHGDEVRLRRLAESTSAHAQRARIVLLAAEGVPNTRIADLLMVSRPTVIAWRRRYSAGGLSALADVPRPGRPPDVSEVDVVTQTLSPPSDSARWTTRTLASELGISAYTVARIWRKWRIRHDASGRVRLLSLPALGVHGPQVVGLYLSPPERAIVITSQPRDGESLNQLVPTLRRAAEREVDDCFLPYRRRDFIAFLQGVLLRHGVGALHVVCEGAVSVRHADAELWLAAHRVQVDEISDMPRWPDVVNVLLALERHRDQEVDVLGIADAIAAFTTKWSDRREHFRWARRPPSVKVLNLHQPPFPSRAPGAIIDPD